MDTPEACAGATIYLGVSVPGALFSLGDGHYTCDWPRIESDEAIMVAGSYRPLEDAYRIAHKDLVSWISQDTGLSLMDTYQLVSQAARSRIANVCDANYTVVAKAPKRFLPSDVPWMQGVHQRMRERGQAVLESLGRR